MEQKLYWGGPILTMEEPFYAEALLTQNGLIQAVGDFQQLKSMAPDAESIPLHGAALMPAFLDAHSHLSGCAYGFLQCSVESANNFESLIRLMDAWLQSHPLSPGQWLVARDLDPGQLEEGRVPDCHVLDQVTSDYPIVLQHRSGHVGVVNSCALQKLGITGETPDPAGGHIDKKDGQPTGYLEENAFLSVLQQLPSPSPQQLLQAFQQAQQFYASFGITTVQEGALMPQLIPDYQLVLNEKALWLDVIAYCPPDSWENTCQALNAAKNQPHFRLEGYKIFLDGSPQSRTAWVTQPYEGGNSCGYPTLSDQQVEQAVKLAQSTGRQLLAHCNGDAAAEQFLKALEKSQACPNAKALCRPVMIHAQLVQPQQLARFSSLGLIPSFFISHIYHWGDIHLENLGTQRANLLSPAGTAEKMGLPYTFHQDSPVLPPNLLESVWCAVTRTARSGKILGKEQRISVLNALHAITTHAAIQYGEQASKGSLRAGKRADLVILDQNPMTVPADSIPNIQILETIKDGQTVWRKNTP